MRILIAGAGVAGRRLAGRLSAGRHDISIIDLNRELCEAVSTELGVVAICGNATDINTLESAEIGRVDVAVALMATNADNLAFSLLASGAGVERVIARMPNPKYRAAYERAGVTSIVDVVGLFLERLMLEIEHPSVHQVASIADGQGAIVWVTVAENAAACGKPLDEIRADRRFPHGCAVSGLIRSDGDRFLLPTGRDRLLAGDGVLLVGTIEGLTRGAELFGERSGLAAFLRKCVRRDLTLEAKEETQARLEATIEGAAEVEELPGEDLPTEPES
jgi:trk system potassium uptake protein TrkA